MAGGRGRRKLPSNEVLVELLHSYTQTEVAEMYGVYPSNVSWMVRRYNLQYDYQPILKTHPLVPSHVLSIWRYKWGWSELKIRERVRALARSWAERSLRCKID